MSDLTPVMGPDDLRYAQELSLHTLKPPLHVPGYEQETFLGKGAFGEVWHAIDSNNGRQVVIKFYSRRGGLDWSLLAREVEKLRYLFSDRHVVQLFDVGWDATPPYYVMEYMENGSLEDKLRAGPLPVDEALPIFREITVGLIHAHGKGIIHCDLKPANILLDQDGRPRLADFGQSRLTHEQTAALGTLYYMAPEQADLHSVPDARWDVYALGAILYHMLAGSPPYRDEPGADAVVKPGPIEDRLERYRALLAQAPRPSGHRRAPGVDAALAEIVDRCLAVDPRRRFPNVQSVLGALDARATKRAQRPLLVLGTIGPVLVVLVMAAISGLLFRSIIAQAERELIQRAEESNRFAAQSLAERFAMEVDKRWRILEAEAADPELRRMLEDPAGAGASRLQALQKWIRARHEYWNGRFSPATAAGYWFAVDRRGDLRLVSPPDDALMGRYFGYRDYFHGLGHELKPTDPRPAPITRAHRSNVYLSQGPNVLAATLSVPIWSLDPGRREPIGVLAMETDLGHFTEFQGTRNQFAVLIDLRPDDADRRGLIVEHPYLEEEEAKSLRLTKFYVAPSVLERAERLQAATRASLARKANGTGPAAGPGEGPEPPLLYEDPVGGAYRGRWIAVIEPVIVQRSRDDLRDSDWVVLVQEHYEDTLRPLRGVRRRVAVDAAVALLLVVVVVTALWLFVLLVLREGRSSRLLSSWRRWRGLPSIGSGTPSVSSVSGSGAGPESFRTQTRVPDGQAAPTGDAPGTRADGA